MSIFWGNFKNYSRIKLNEVAFKQCELSILTRIDQQFLIFLSMVQMIEYIDKYPEKYILAQI